jgi:hypothetical protein
MPPEGALSQSGATSEARVSGEAPQALPVEGALKPQQLPASCDRSILGL